MYKYFHNLNKANYSIALILLFIQNVSFYTCNYFITFHSVFFYNK